jgi:hypothetical protein
MHLSHNEQPGGYQLARWVSTEKTPKALPIHSSFDTTDRAAAPRAIGSA